MRVFPKKDDVVVITGCAGFIGSHLTMRLLAEGCRVIGIDNLITGNLDNISDAFKDKNFDFYHHDVTKFIHIPGRVDYVLHFASPASPADYLKMPIHTMKVGAMGTLNALGLAKDKGAVFMLASTSEVYGDPDVHPQPETFWGNVNPVGVRGVYDEAKRFAEALTLAYHRVHKVNVRIARIFNTYGPKMRLNDGRVIPNFITQALQKKPITIYGDGSQTRSFCYIDDLINGIIELIRVDYHYPVNLGNPEEIKIIDLAKTIIEIVREGAVGDSPHAPLKNNDTKDIKFEFCPLPENDPKRRCPDISLAKKLLNWEPKIPLREGLKKTIEYVKQQLTHAT